MSAERELLDDDGENRAVRSFLTLYTSDRPITLAEMGQHMNRSGWPSEYWPDFARKVGNASHHLTKAGAQIWLRHLFDMEAAPSSPALDEAKVREKALEEAAEAVKDHSRKGREWVPGSLWDTLSNEASARILGLKSSPAQQDGWISVETRLPELLTPVLAYCKGAESVGIAYLTGMGWLMPEPQAIGHTTITHWRELPPSPCISDKGVGNEN